jgi:hypothetical protein
MQGNRLKVKPFYFEQTVDRRYFCFLASVQHVSVRAVHNLQCQLPLLYRVDFLQLVNHL